MANLSAEDATLILKGWFDKKTSLFATTQSDGISVVVPSCRIVELDSDTAQLLGDAQISIGGLAKPETKFWYAEPREFLDKLAALSIPVPDAEKCLSAVGIAFFARVCGPGMEDLLVPVGKVAFWELRG